MNPTTFFSSGSFRNHNLLIPASDQCPPPLVDPAAAQPKAPPLSQLQSYPQCVLFPIGVSNRVWHRLRKNQGLEPKIRCPSELNDCKQKEKGMDLLVCETITEFSTGAIKAWFSHDVSYNSNETSVFRRTGSEALCRGRGTGKESPSFSYRTLKILDQRKAFFSFDQP